MGLGQIVMELMWANSERPQNTVRVSCPITMAAFMKENGKITINTAKVYYGFPAAALLLGNSKMTI